MALINGKSKVLAGLTSAFLLFAVTVSWVRAQIPDETIHSCVNLLGRLRIVDSPADCHALEEPLDWSKGGSATLGGQLQVVDANGVHTLFYSYASEGVREIGDSWVNLTVSEDRMALEANSSAWFEGVDCTGDLYLDFYGGVYSVAWTGDHETFYYAAASSEATPFTAASYKNSNSDECIEGDPEPGRLRIMAVSTPIDLSALEGPFKLSR